MAVVRQRLMKLPRRLPHCKGWGKALSTCKLWRQKKTILPSGPQALRRSRSKELSPVFCSWDKPQSDRKNRPCGLLSCCRQTDPAGAVFFLTASASTRPCRSIPGNRHSFCIHLVSSFISMLTDLFHFRQDSAILKQVWFFTSSGLLCHAAGCAGGHTALLKGPEARGCSGTE